MKKLLLLPTLLILLIAGGCRKSNSPTNRLPAETHNGANTMGCYVNNHLFIPQEPGLDPNPFYGANIQPAPSFDLHLFWMDKINSSNNTNIAIFLDSIQLTQGATYTLGAPADSLNQNANAQWATYLAQGFYYTTGQVNGQVTIDYYDPMVSAVTGIVSGHFSFDAVDNIGDTVHITQGRFDMTTVMQ